MVAGASDELSFRTIDLDRHAQIAIAFRRDSPFTRDALAHPGEIVVDRAERVFRPEGAGATLVRLSVSPTNARALEYYRKYSWRDLGPRPDDASLRWMELSIHGSR